MAQSINYGTLVRLPYYIDFSSQKLADNYTMKVLVIAPTPFFSNRGCHIRIAEEATASTRKGMTLKVITYFLGDTPEDVKIVRTIRIPWYSKKESGPSWHKLYIDGLLFLKTMRVARKWKPDVIHAHLHEGILVAWAARFFLKEKPPLVFDAQGSLVKEMEGHLKRLVWPLRPVLNFFERLSYKVSDGIVTSSDSLKQFIHDNGLLPADTPCEVAADSAQPVDFISEDERTELRKTLKLNSSHCLCVYAGGMTNDKGVDLFFDAVIPLLEQFPKVHVLCIGDPHQHYKEIAEKKQVADRFTFLGHVPFEEVSKYQQSADISVDPKPPTSTQSSGKILNYMAAKLPVVAFQSINTDHMLPSDTLLATETTVPSLGTALQEAFSASEETLHKIGEDNYQHLLQHFSWDNTAEVIDRMYRKLLKE